MTALTTLALALSSVLGLAGAADQGPEPTAERASTAMVRIDITDHDSGKRVRRSSAVAWSSEASFALDVGGHAFQVDVTPQKAGNGASIDLDLVRDTAVLADDLHVVADGRRFEVSKGEATVVVTVVPVTTTIDAG